MLQSIIVYALVIPLFYLLAKGNAKSILKNSSEGFIIQRNSPFFTWSTIAIIVLFAFFCGIRYDVGRDYLSYLTCYLNYGITGDFLSNRLELGFTSLMDICYRLKLSPMVFFGLVSLIQITFFLLAFRREQYLWPLLLLFLFINGGYMLWMNGMRQTMALCIWLCSLYFIEEKKPLLYILFCLLAILFHQSSIILVVFYPILRSGRAYFENRAIQYGLIIIAFVINFSFMDYLVDIMGAYVRLTGSVYDSYINNYDEFGSYSNTNIVYWYRILVYCIIIYYSGKMRDFYKSKRFNIIYTLYFIGVLSQCAIPIGMGFLARPFLFFSFLNSVMFAYFVYYLSKVPEGWNNMIKIVMIVSFIGVFFLNQIVSGEGSSVWYQFYFEQPQSVLLSM